MSIRACFTGKVAAGIVNPDAASRILNTMDEVGRERGATHAARVAAAIGNAEAIRRANLYYGQTIAQTNVLRAFHNYNQAIQRLRETPGAFGFGNKAPPGAGKDTQSTLGLALNSLVQRDLWEIATWPNVQYMARQLRGEAHAMFADAIEHLMPKVFGFKEERVRELDVLRQAFGAAGAEPQSAAVWKAWNQVAKLLGENFVDAGGDLHVRDDYFPNPTFDTAKVKSLGEERFKQLVRDNVDRTKMIDFRTDLPMHDGRFEALLDDAWRSIVGYGDGIPTAGGGKTMLANGRAAPRLFQWKNAEAWTAIAEKVGEHASPYQAMINHIESITTDTALMRVLGPNPEATKKFAVELLNREAARLQVAAVGDTPAELRKATKQNQAIENRVALDTAMFENAYAEAAGLNRIPVSTTMAKFMGETRAWLSASQLGSAMISSFTDPVTMAMTARFDGLSVTNVIRRATAMMAEAGSEKFAAQQGLVFDTLAHLAHSTDRVVGETIRSGFAAKLANANIRVSGLRRWTSVLRSAFALEMMAHAAEHRGKAFGELEGQFRETLSRYGIGAGEWDVIRATTPHEPRPDATFIRALDIAADGNRQVAERWSRLVNTEMDYAVLDQDPLTRSWLLGASRPGTIGGEARRSVAMYRSFPATFIATHGARALARGWDGNRLAHGATTFAMMSLFGAVAMQAKEIASGRDPLSLNPTEANGLRAWGKAIIQGGGLGVFGDLFFVDQTRYGTTWAATLAGPVAGAVEAVLGDFAIKNLQLAAKGKETHFLGDALYAVGRHVPGSSLWFARGAFNRDVLDQLALWADPRTRERFARMEETARRDFGQDYWWRPGRTTPSRGPNLEAIGGRQ